MNLFASRLTFMPNCLRHQRVISIYGLDVRGVVNLMLTAFGVKGDIRSNADITCELALPGISVKPPLKVPPSIYTGGVGNFPVEALTPNFANASMSEPIGRLLREGPPTSVWWPGIREHIAVINLNVV